MACDFDITKENIYDYIIEDTPGADEAIKALSGICSQRADSQWIIAHGELPDNRQLNISSLGYFTIPKLYGLMEGDADISALDEIGALRVLGQDNLQADGSNVLIGYVDTGIDYLMMFSRTDLEIQGFRLYGIRQIKQVLMLQIHMHILAEYMKRMK